jgi:hypothetical protein
VLIATLLASCGPRGSARDLDGKPFDPLAKRAITALVFVSSECPISNRYAPALKQLATSRAPQGVRFWLVYPDRTDDATKIRKHLADYDYGMRALRDPEHVLVERAGARVTPEVALFAKDGTLAYRGRIDDRYAAFGKERPAAQRHDLADALAHVLRGERVTPPETTAVGCAISD